MSKPRRRDDVERTVLMLDLVHRVYVEPSDGRLLSHVVVEEVAPGVGWAAHSRWADVLALGMWPSKGLTLDGYEVKASRADLKRELADPAKHKASARYCDHWWLVAWDESVLLDGLPESWGVMVTVETEDGERELKVLKEAPKLTAEPWPRHFICSLVRNAYQQSPGARYVGRACAAARESGTRDGRSAGQHDLQRLLLPLAKAVWGDQWPREAYYEEARVIEAAITALGQGILARPAPTGEGGEG